MIERMEEINVSGADPHGEQTLVVFTDGRASLEMGVKDGTKTNTMGVLSVPDLIEALKKAQIHQERLRTQGGGD